VIRKSAVISLIVAISALACRDDRLPTQPTVAPVGAVQAITAEPVRSGASTICLVNQKALSDLDGQVQDNPGHAQLQAEYDVQAAITAEVCD
jgi:hypothetical protein